MIDVVHVDEQTALQTARIVLQKFGPEHELSRKWLAAAHHFGYLFRPDRPGLFSKPV